MYHRFFLIVFGLIIRVLRLIFVCIFDIPPWKLQFVTSIEEYQKKRKTRMINPKIIQINPKKSKKQSKKIQKNRSKLIDNNPIDKILDNPIDNPIDRKYDNR